MNDPNQPYPDLSQIVQISMGEIRYVPAPPPKPKGFAWKGIGDGLGTFRSIMLTALLIASLLGATYLVGDELLDESLAIHPLELPDSMKKSGHSEGMAAHMLLLEVERIIGESTNTLGTGDRRAPNLGDTTGSSKLRRNARGAWERKLDVVPARKPDEFNIPGAGISLNSIAAMVGKLVQIKKSWVDGEFICAGDQCDPKTVSLRLRIIQNGQATIIRQPPLGEDTLEMYYHKAALSVLRVVDPSIVLSFLYQTGNGAARQEALNQLQDPTNNIRHEVFNILGLIAANDGKFDEAIEWFQQAVEADPEKQFVIAYNNWGDALFGSDDLDGAIEKYQRATEIDPANAVAFSSWGNTLVHKGELDAAVEKFRHAITLDPNASDPYNSWGNALYYWGDLDGAVEKYAEAAKIDPKKLGRAK